MNLVNIELYARSEISLEEKSAVLKRIRDAIARTPEGAEFYIETVLMPWVVATCDDKKIPVYPMSNTLLLVASTYRNLFEYIKVL